MPDGTPGCDDVGTIDTEVSMEVAQLMTQDVTVCGPDDSLHDVARRMWERDCGSLPVCDGDGRVIGMVTDRDICMNACFEDKPLSQLMVSGAMSGETKACHPGTSLNDAERMLQEGQLHRLPVIGEEGRLAGIITLGDIAREAAREREMDLHEVELDEVGMTVSAVSQPRAAVA